MASTRPLGSRHGGLETGWMHVGTRCDFVSQVRLLLSYTSLTFTCVFCFVFPNSSYSLNTWLRVDVLPWKPAFYSLIDLTLHFIELSPYPRLCVMLEAFPGTHCEAGPSPPSGGSEWTLVVFPENAGRAHENPLGRCSLELLSFYQVDVAEGHILWRSFPSYISVLRTPHTSHSTSSKPVCRATISTDLLRLLEATLTSL